jgi:hypothetical protein
VRDASAASWEFPGEDQQSGMRQSGGKRLAGGQDDIVAIVRDHDAPIGGSGLEVDRVVLRERRLCVSRRNSVETERSPDGRGSVGHVFVQIEPRVAHPPGERVKSSSSDTRAAVQYASRSNRSSISAGHAR